MPVVQGAPTGCPFHDVHSQGADMPQYNPPLRDMQFVLHEVMQVTEAFK